MFSRLILYNASNDKLQNATRFENSHFTKLVKVSSVYDGDTFTVVFVSKFKLYRRRCRCLGYDSPEMKSSDPIEKERAIEARDFLKEKLPSGIFRIYVKGLDKYGRWLVEVYINNTTLCETMISNNHGYAYHGGTKQKN